MFMIYTIGAVVVCIDQLTGVLVGDIDGTGATGGFVGWVRVKGNKSSEIFEFKVQWNQM